MNEYSCKPAAEPGCFIISIEFGEPRWIDHGDGPRPCPGLRGFYRAGMTAFMTPNDNAAMLVAAVHDLESIALKEKPTSGTIS